MGGLTIAMTDVPVEDAFDVVLGYAFEVMDGEWREPRNAVGDAVTGLTVPRWAYRTYDCIAPDPSPRLQGVDLFIADGINGRMDGRRVSGLLSVADEVSEALAEIPPELTFWDLDVEEVSGPPADHSRAWPVWRAWTVLMGVKHCDVAITHKTLHHKRPSVFPLIDGTTLAQLGAGSAWQQIHADLTSVRDTWLDLEQRFTAVAEERGGVPLTRLRMHDILLWTATTGNWETALAAGRRLRSGGEVTPSELAAELGVDSKTLRAWLRREYPRSAVDHDSRWVLSVDQCDTARSHFGGPRTS